MLEISFNRFGSDEAVVVRATRTGVEASQGGTAAVSARSVERLVVYGDVGDDDIRGGSGADTLSGGLGRDTIDGGRRVDTLNLHDKFAALELTLDGRGRATLFVAGAAEDTVRNVEDILGGAGADRFGGDDGANRLAGWFGADTLTGGGGADVFAFDSSYAEVDTITDFGAGNAIELSAGVFGAIPPGELAASAFVAGTAATDPDDRILYDRASGALLYDADGFGAGAAFQFATFEGRPELTAADIFVA